MSKSPGNVNSRVFARQRRPISPRGDASFADTEPLFPDGLFDCDRYGRLVRLNSQGLRLFGYSQTDLEAGLHIWDLIASANEEKLKAHFPSFPEGQDSVELTGCTKAGEQFPLVLRWIPLKSNHSQCLYRGAIQDIRRLKTAEHLISVLHNFGLALGLTRDLREAMGQVLKFSCEIEGIDSGSVFLVESLTGGIKLGLCRGLPSSYPETADFYDFASQQTRLIMAGKPIYFNHPKIDITFPPVDAGQMGMLSCQAIIPMSHSGQILAALILYTRKRTLLMGSIKNSLEAIGSRMASHIARNRVVAALKENESKNRLLLETMNEGFMIVDGELTLNYANKKLCSMLGYYQDEIIGLPLTYFLDESNKKILLDHHKRAKDGETASFEITWTDDNGNEVPTIASPRIMLDDNAHFNGYCIVLTDIGELREALKTIKMKEQELIDKMQKIDELSIAMKVLLSEREGYRKQLEQNILSNIRNSFGPLLERIKSSSLSRQQEIMVDLLESAARDLFSSFSVNLSIPSLGLSSMEIQVANLLKEGRSSKEIARILNLSSRTVDSHRLNIRKKMGISHKPENLSARLLSLK